MGRTSSTVRILLLLGLLLAACGPPTTSPPVETLIEAPTEVVIVPSLTSTAATIAPTDTLAPPTDTPVPSTPTLTPTPSKPNVTHIAIDGDSADWTNYAILLTDEEGDAFQGGFDLKSVRAFTNDRYLYLMLDAYNGIGEYVQVDLDIDADGDGKQDYMATFRPRTGRQDLGDFTTGEEVWGPLQGSAAAEGVVVEFKMPLTLIAGHESFTLNIRVMNGECCDEAWYVVDDMGPASIGRAYEQEMTLAEQFTRWLSLPFTGLASAPFVINDTDPALAGARRLVINEAETTAYIAGEFSAQLSKVDIDPTSPTFGQATVIASDLLLRPNGLAVNRAETVAYVTTEIGYDRTGTNRLVQVDLTTGEAATVSDQMGQPTDIALSQDETEGYVVDLQRGELYRMNLDVGSATLIAAGLNSPYPVAVNQAETLAYIVTEPARAGDYPRGDLLSIDLQTGQVSTVAAGAIFGATGITLSADERLAFVTEFGHEADCDGSLSIINIDPGSTDLGKKTVLVTGLCGAHDVEPNATETLAYFVEVDASRFSVIRVNLSVIRGP